MSCKVPLTKIDLSILQIKGACQLKCFLNEEMRHGSLATNLRRYLPNKSAINYGLKDTLKSCKEYRDLEAIFQIKYALYSALSAKMWFPTHSKD